MPIIIDGVEYLTVEDVAQRYGYGEFYIRSLARRFKQGKKDGLKAIKRGRIWLFKPEDVVARLIEGGADATE